MSVQLSGGVSEGAASARALSAVRASRDVYLPTHLLPTYKVWLAAEAAPRATKEYVDRTWNGQYSPKGGATMEEMLECVDLIDVHYLIALGEAGGVVPRWQEVPECAKSKRRAGLEPGARTAVSPAAAPAVHPLCC